MQGRFALIVKVVAASAAVWLLAGCGQPRIKSMESAQAATMSNPPRDFKAAPLDPYSWGGIAMATGGRDSRTTYGALSPSGQDGVNEVYLPGPNMQAPKPSDDTSKIYLVPDPRDENKAQQYVGSRYLDNEGNTIVDKPGVINADPERAALAKPEQTKPAGSD